MRDMSKSYFYLKKCNFCDSKKRKVLYKLKEQKIVTCEKCNLIYFDKQRNDIEHLYNENYYSCAKDNSVANYAEYEDQELAVKKNFNFAYEYIKKNKKPGPARILEIGPGFGYFAKYLPRGVLYEA